MKPRLLLGLLVALWLIFPRYVEAVPVHDFDCKNCHASGVTLAKMADGSLCLQCHKDAPPDTAFINGVSPRKAKGLFHPNDASNALGTATAAGNSPTLQTSHYWSAPKDVSSAAGAAAPSKALYTSRYSISTGKVTCTRCHDPHLPIETDPKLLRMTEAGDAICLDCHRPWDTIKNPSLQRGLLTHPLVANYAAVAAANPTKYKANVANVGSGDVKLMAGGVTCTSCHGTHFTDSHSGTVDGRDNRAGLQAGDGKLLRSDGPKRSGATAAETAQLRSNLCQACHTYKTHGDGNPIGCLDCHSGHVYDQSNPTTPNYFVLRANISNVWMPKNPGDDKKGNVVGAKFKSATAEWMNAGGTGYCQSCHTIDTPHNTHYDGAATSCGECHYHGHAERSFTAQCNDCHGTPPTSEFPAPVPGGYASSGQHDYQLSANGAYYKNESTTPHVNHAGGADYKFSCDVCHLGKTHNNGTFQDVFIAGKIHSLASGTGRTTPSYNGTNPGTCSAVYCHSNGGKRTGDGTRTFKTLAVTWAGQKNAITTCDACHGNSSASMLAADKDNSSSHQKHLAKGYGCKVCHTKTAATATALVPAAINGMHVNGLADVFFDLTHNLGADTLKVGATPYIPATGTCSVYCHSNGSGSYATPDWDSAASGACGSCHGARVGDAAVISSGSHGKHVSDVKGPQLGCDACHGVGAATGGHAGHVNGMVNAPAASVCTSCHAVDDGETTPVWGDSATSTCESCHGGATVSVIGGKTAPAKPLAASSGHNKPSGSYSLSGKNAANKTCVACHDAAAAGHFGASGDSRLSVGFSCSSCHSSVLTHQAKACVACHDPHGTSNGYMIYSSQVTQNAKDASASGKFSGNVVFTAKTGADSYDELDAGAGVNADDLCASCHSSASGTSHNNREVSGPAHQEGTNCTSCHAHAKAFRPVGTACNQCHGNAPTTGAHAFHAIIGGHTDAEDRSDCAVCHLGADSYTYDPSADMAGGLNHGNAAGRKTKLTDAVGFNVANQTCASACHKSSVADGAWGDTDGLACDSCHYWSATPTLAGNDAYTHAGGAAAPLGAKHSKHFDITTAPVVCGDCHGTVTTDLTFKRGHNNFKTAATDADKIRYQGYGFLNPTGTGVLVDDRSFNGAVNSWVNSAVTNDGGNTCANAACHNPSKTTYKADWDADVASCNLCHSATDPATGAHGKHLTSRGAVYGGDVACSTCHVDNGANMAHRNGTVNLRSIPKSANCHSCHIQPPANCNMACHTGASGLSNIWQKTGVVTGCASCHPQTPTSNDHTIHISGTYGPLTGSDCSVCHQSQANNTSMSGVGTHMNLKVTLRNRAVPASPYEVSPTTIGQAANDAVDSCNACHGGAAAALLAKDYWTTATRVSCESCHGTTASLAVIGVAAPDKSAYAGKGHGKTGVAKSCADCHDNAGAHISGSLGDAKRLKTIAGKTYTAEAPNAFCGACHDNGSGNETPHFAVGEGHNSTDATRCNACHDPHGVTGYDAMVKSSIDGRSVAVFADKTQRASYATNGNDGICQVCHVADEVRYFNRSTNDTNHAVGRLCIGCHDHKAEVAFKASCSGCHGGGFVGTTSGASNFWPDGLREHDANDAGAHQKHMLEIAARFNPAWTTVDALLNGATITQQLEMCEFCHAAVTNDNDHGNPGTADVFLALVGEPPAKRFAKQLWAPFAADNNAAYSAGSCSAVDCHNGKTTPEANKWYPGHGTSTCIMCHDGEVGGPASGSHVAHRGSNSTFAYNFTCGNCHQSAMTWSDTAAGTKPAAGHIDGVKVVGITGDFTYNFNTLSCGTNSCHNDGKGGSPKIAHAWGTEIDGCTNCHLWFPNTEGHTAHFDFDNNTVGARLGNCTPCHPISSPNHINRSVNFIAGMNYDGDVDVRPDSGFGKCSTTICHNNGLGIAVVTPLWTQTAAGVGKATCTLCHAGVPNTGSHGKHVLLGQVPTTYDGANLAVTSDTDYSYRCDTCHGNNLSKHVNGSPSFVQYLKTPPAGFEDIYDSGAKTCSVSYCHSNGAVPPVYTVTPAWGSSFPGDPCAGCHGNSPNNDVHHEHEVGFHYKAVYSGTTGFLPVRDSDPLPPGLAGNISQLRGHGGRLLDGTPSSTTLTCNVCHFDTVQVSHNSTNATCKTCHTTPANPTPEQKAVGNAAMTIADKTKHVNGERDVKFFDQKVRSKAQLRDDLKDVPELANNWKRVGGYKAATGLSYDEQPDILSNMATWNSADKTCTVACHLWEANRVDKVPAKWDGGAIMCIDCHTRLPK